MKRLSILGASGHGKVVAEIAEILGWNVVFFDDAYPNIKKIEGWSVIGNTGDLVASIKDGDGCFVAIGNNTIRLNKYELLASNGAKIPVLIHPSAIISRYSTVGEGSVVMAGVVINSFAEIGKYCILNTSCTIDHDCVLGNSVHVSPGANLAGAVAVGECAWIGLGSGVRQGIKIGKNVTVGAGAVVIEDLPENVMAVGVPAVIKESRGSKC